MLRRSNKTHGRLIFRGGGVSSPQAPVILHVINVKVILLGRIQDRDPYHDILTLVKKGAIGIIDFYLI